MDTQAEDLQAVRALLAAERHGVLSTLHAALGGSPFGSLAPYAADARGDPVFLLSAIAEHSRNLRADPRASLLVQDRRALDEPLAGARATFVGVATPPTGAARRAAVELYLARFPEAESWASAHDFAPFVLHVERIRWIRGFGTMGWIVRAEWTRA